MVDKINRNFRAEDGAWIAPTLVNSWVDFGSSYETAGYQKESNGTIRLKGKVKSGTVAYQTAVFTLPAGFRPSLIQTFPVCSNGAFGIVTVETDGVVSVVVGNNTYVSLDGISFKI